MAEDARPSTVEKGSSLSLGETAGDLTSSSVSEKTTGARQGEKGIQRKQYYKERDATRIYLFEQFQRWRTMKDELKLKMDKELASVLLDFYENSKKRVFR